MKTGKRTLAARIKKIKCPNCHKKIDPNKKAFDKEFLDCNRGRGCGLRLVNRDKLADNEQTPVLFLPKQVETRKPVSVVEEGPQITVKFDDPLVIHVFDSKTKQVINE